MQTPGNAFSDNPLAGLISDDDYRRLTALQLLSPRGIRDYQMRTAFRKMRREKIPATAAIERLRHEHPYLQTDTIRKIVYNTGAQR